MEALVSFTRSSRACFDDPSFGVGGVLRTYIFLFMVFVANTSFHIADNLISMPRVWMEYGVSAAAVFFSIYTCLDRLVSDVFGLLV